MKMMKKLLTAVVAIAAISAFAGCTNDYTVAEYQAGVKDNTPKTPEDQGGGNYSAFTIDTTNESSEIGAALKAAGKKAAIASKTYDGKITIGGAGATRTNSDALSVELAKSGGTVSFEVGPNATIKIDVASTGANNTSEFEVSGAGIAKTSDSIAGSTFTTKTYTSTAAGTFTLNASMADRGTRFNKIVVTY